MEPAIDRARSRPRRRRRRDFGRIAARLLCFVFALVGAIPLTGGFVLGSAPVKRWAADETSRLLREQLGVEATFTVELTLIPLRLAVTDLTVASSDGNGPALTTGLAAVSPRFFSLLAGRIDVGDVEFEDVRARVVIRDGKVDNVAYRLPPRKSGKTPTFEHSPFRSLSITSAALDLTIDDFHVESGNIDLDAFAEPGLRFDVALQIAYARTTHSRAALAAGSDAEHDGRVAVDEDVLCALDVRAELGPERVVVRRLSLLGGLDPNPGPNTRPDCTDLHPTEELAVRMTQVKLDFPSGSKPTVSGQVMARAPAPVANRYVKMGALRGWAGFSGEIAYDGRQKLPEVDGQITGEGLGLGRYAIAEKLRAHVRITGDVIELPEVEARYADGDARIRGVRLEPFSPKIPLRIASVVTSEATFPALMRDLGTAPHTIVDWNFGRTEVTNVGGTILPFYLDGRVVADTHDFKVNDRAFHDPAKKRMIGVENGHIDGRFRVHAKALEFYDTETSFGTSKIGVELVSIGFSNDLAIVLRPESVIELSDVGPIAGVAVGGTAKLGVSLFGQAAHPKLDGSLAVDDLLIGGFEVGDLEEAKVHFEPLFVDLIDARGRKGDMSFHLPKARLAFGKSASGGASLEFSADVRSESFVVRRFFEIFEFDEDPRFADVNGEGKLEGSVHYVLGGSLDTCKGGRLTARGSTHLRQASLFGETYGGATSRFDFEWFDMRAGARGLRLDVSELSLSKGSGTIFGTARIEPGGRIDGEFVGTRVPIARIDALGSIVDQSAGFVTGGGRLGGHIEALTFDGRVQISELKAGSLVLPASSLSIRLVPPDRPMESSTEKSGCGRPLPLEFDPNRYAKDETDGDFVVSGSLFGGQVGLSDVRISRQRSKRLSGDVALVDLDLGATIAYFAGNLMSAPPKGRLTGSLHVESVSLDRPLAGKAEFDLTRLVVEAAGARLRTIDPEARLVLGEGHLAAEHLVLEAETPGGSKGILDANFDLDERGALVAGLRLRPTDLGVLLPALPGVERATGQLTAHLSATGSWARPVLTGAVAVHDGTVELESLNAPLTELELEVTLDARGAEVRRGSANWGGGRVGLRGGVPLTNGELGTTDLEVATTGVTLALDDDVRVTFDSALRLTFPPFGKSEAPLPRLTGTVEALAASYERPIAVTADIASLASRGKKTEVDTYSPDKDSLEFDVLVRSKAAIQVENELVDAALALDPAGVRVTGTNQRYGAVGNVEIPRGGRIYLRGHTFEVQEGLVRFNDPTKLRPEVDVTAVTDYRRYQDQNAAPTATASGAASGGSATPGSGNWRIVMHAYGPPDSLRVDLASDPALSSDDIFLLLTVGLTRTELDQSRQAGVGSSVALEALGSLSGAEGAVTNTVPIDEFRFGSTYSSRSGRTEPTVTIGKRLSERIRASVTTSLSDSSEVRSNVEYRATPNLSVEGSYDNAQSSGSANVGNVGGDVRWRLEFE